MTPFLSARALRDTCNRQEGIGYCDPPVATLAEVEVEVNPMSNKVEAMKAKVGEAPGSQVKVEITTPRPHGKQKLLGPHTPPAHPRTTLGTPKEGGQDPLRTDARMTQKKLLLASSANVSSEVTQIAPAVLRVTISQF